MEEAMRQVATLEAAWKPQVRRRASTSRAKVPFPGRTAIALGCLFLALACPRARAESPNGYRLVLGEDPAASLGKKGGASVSADEEKYVRKVRAVRLDLNLMAKSSPLQVGDVLILDLFSNATYSVVIDSLTQDDFGSVSILGTIAGAPFGTVVLTAHGGALIGTVQDLDQGKLFCIRSLDQGREHHVLDYDVAKMPAKYDGPALVPPADPLPGGGP